MTNPTPPTEAENEAHDEDRADRQARNYRRAKRGARERATEIKELNITAMMDMMTIILVFLIKSYSASSTNVNMTDDLKVPASTTTTDPKDAINVTITMSELLVNDKAVAKVVGGVIPASYRQGKVANSPFIEPLYVLLDKEVQKQKYIAQYNPKAPFEGRVNIVADQRVPYQTLTAVLFTAGRAEASAAYKLMVLKRE